jgi:hypothetical protein
MGCGPAVATALPGHDEDGGSAWDVTMHGPMLGAAIRS